MRERENKIMYKIKKVKLDGYVPSDEYDYARKIDSIIRQSDKWYLVTKPPKPFGGWVFRPYTLNDELFYLYCLKSNNIWDCCLSLNQEDIETLEKHSEIIQLSFWESCNLIVKKTILTQYFYLKCKLRNKIYYPIQKKINIAKKINLTLVSIIIQLITLFYILFLF